MIAGEKVATLCLHEKYRQVEVPNEKDQRWGLQKDRVPTEMLILSSGPASYDKCFCRDTPKLKRVEDSLNKVILDFVMEAGFTRIKRREEQARKQREEELWRKRQELQQRQKEEQANVDQLIKYANNWRQSQIIRLFLKAIRRMLVAQHGKMPEQGETVEYLAWAQQQADRLDPLVVSPHSVLDERL